MHDAALFGGLKMSCSELGKNGSIVISCLLLCFIYHHIATNDGAFNAIIR
jgi:hypothetical protein